jgi:S-DNA-T family DNA segregation ATPase FtsK/SpoIIIE
VELIDGLRDRRQREKQLEARRQVIDRMSRKKKRKPPKIKPLQPPLGALGACRAGEAGAPV